MDNRVDVSRLVIDIIDDGVVLEVYVPPVCVTFADADAVEEVESSSDDVIVVVEETLDEGIEELVITADIVFIMVRVKGPLAEAESVFVPVALGDCVEEELIVAVLDGESVLELVNTALEVDVEEEEIDIDDD